MNDGWRSWALTAATLLCVCGLAVLASGAGPAMLIVGAIALVSVLLERSYGRVVRRPLGENWRPTDEKFVDPDSGELVTVWMDPATGERRYVAEPASDKRC
jgi:hypothetical protein